MKWIIIIAVALVVIFGGVWYFTHGGDEAPQYQSVTVERGELIQMVTATGTLNPVVNVQIGCQVSGRIKKLYVDFNSVVQSNQLLAEIDTSTYQAQVNQAEADLSNARANLELQQIQAKRSNDLFTNRLVSASDNDITTASLHEAEAMVQIKQASLTNAMANLGYTKIYSPVDGVVISRSVDVGQTVAASLSAPVLFQIANDLTRMQIDANVAEADIGGIEEGQDVMFTVDAFPYRTFHGSVTQVRNAPTTLNNVVTYDCVIGVTNADSKLKPGMTANISVVIAQREDVIKIPNGALRFRPPETVDIQTNSAAATNQIAQNSGGGNRPGGGQGRRGGRGGGRARGERPVAHTVYILAPDSTDKNPKLQPVQVRTGISDGINTEVVDGLKEGDRLVTGLVITDSAAASPTANPFGGGRIRRF